MGGLFQGVLAIPVLVFGLVSNSRASDSIALPFDRDAGSLCFFNADPDLATQGPPILGPWGAKRGVCQGIAGTAAAFFEHAQFDPGAPRPTERQAKELVEDAIRLHKGACGSMRIRVPGYWNLNEFCRDHRRLFLRAATWYNANIAMREILAVLGSFEAHKDHPLKSRKDRKRLEKTLISVENDLLRGRAPLLMYFSHVVMVYELHKERDSAGRLTAVVAKVYDSNVPDPAQLRIHYDTDGLPSLSNSMLWNVTPDRWNWRCHR